MTTILAVDPGLVNPGAAVIRDGILLTAERVKLPREWKSLPIVERCDRIAAQITSWMQRYCLHPHIFCIEFPQWYGETASGGKDPNDLAGLACIAGALAARMEAEQVLNPTPREVWGNVPKNTKGNPWDSPRGRRLAARLSPVERPRVQKYHDALDAAGLALFAAGRWEPQRVFSGAV